MSTYSRLAGALLFTTALSFPTFAYAQDEAQPTPPMDDVAPAEEEVDISVPGGSGVIVVTGRVNRDPAQTSAQVMSVLSTADIARTGEGDIAGALSRVTGLSVVGNGFVYVRGLGDRYSLALLNGSPLPSPEPLKRVVPLDLFPTSVVSSSLVQKSYSVNFPGEFGGGVINLTSRSTPDETFLTVGGSLSGDVETTFQRGNSYYGSGSDWLGYDDGARDIAPALQDYFDNGLLAGTDITDTSDIAGQLVTADQAVIQTLGDVPANWGASLSTGTTIELGDGELGIIAAGSYSNSWATRDSINQRSTDPDLGSVDNEREVSTTQNVLVNGMLGVGLELGDQTIRWTSVYIHDTIKRASLAEGRPANSVGDVLEQRTGFYERQLINTQLVGEFEFNDINLDLRGSYANTRRDAPGELFFQYVRSNSAQDPYGSLFVNLLNLNRGTATATYSELEEDLYSGGVDLTVPVLDTLNLTVGGAYTLTQRGSSRRDFLFLSSGSSVIDPRTGNTVTDPNFLAGIGTLRPDVLLSPTVVDAFNIQIIENDPGAPAFDAELEIYGAYGKIDLVLGDIVTIDAGVRYERADQQVLSRQVFASQPQFVPPPPLEEEYFLPAATITVDLDDGMQARVSASKTIARPQFRELVLQPFYDPDSNREYLGNPFLIDSELINAEARFEWFFARGQRLSLAGFYKKIDNPIESFVVGDLNLQTSYANAPEASLYGGEFELQKYFDLESLGGTFFDSRQLVLIANYTYTKSELKVESGDTVAVLGNPQALATSYFSDGAPLTGQSDHLVNLQIGFEDLDRLSQQTLLVTFASDRVVSRGRFGTVPQPDVIEEPGVRLDFVMREGVTLGGVEAELKFEARNLLGTRHQEYQELGSTRIDVNTYDVGQSFSAGLSFTF